MIMQKHKWKYIPALDYFIILYAARNEAFVNVAASARTRGFGQTENQRSGKCCYKEILNPARVKYNGEIRCSYCELCEITREEIIGPNGKLVKYYNDKRNECEVTEECFATFLDDLKETARLPRGGYF